jgi:hypothetical protein
MGDQRAPYGIAVVVRVVGVLVAMAALQAVSTGTIFLHKNIKTNLSHTQKGTFEGLAGIALSRGRDIPGH